MARDDLLTGLRIFAADQHRLCSTVDQSEIRIVRVIGSGVDESRLFHSYLQRIGRFSLRQNGAEFGEFVRCVCYGDVRNQELVDPFAADGFESLADLVGCS